MSSKCAQTENIVRSPHMGSRINEACTEMSEKVILSIKTFLNGHKPPDRVIAAMI